MKENNNKEMWKKILTFVIEVIKLVIAIFLGVNAANII